MNCLSRFRQSPRLLVAKWHLCRIAVLLAVLNVMASGPPCALCQQQDDDDDFFHRVPLVLPVIFTIN